MKERIRKIGESKLMAAIAIPLIAFLTAFAASNNPFSVGKIGKDSAVYQYIARVILDGGMPYRDSFDHKGPVIYLIDAAGLAINPSLGIWIIEIVFLLGTFFFAYKTARLLGCGRRAAVVSVLVCALSLVLYFQGGNHVEEYAVLFLMMSLFVFAKHFIKKNVKCYEILLCGAAFAIVGMLRINMVVLWAVMCIGVLVDCIKGKRNSDIAKYLGWFLMGAAIIVVPILAWLSQGGATRAFFEDYILFNLKYSSDEKRASFTNMWNAFFTFVTAIPVVFSLVILVHSVLEKRRLIDILCTLTVFLSVLSMSISGQAYGHYGMILCPLIAYAFALLFSEVAMKKGRALSVSICGKERSVSIISVKAVILVLLVLFSITSRQKVVYEAESELEEIAQTIKDNTDDEDKITVLGNRDIIYLVSSRKSASLYSYQSPIADIDPNIKKEFWDDIRSLKAVIIVVSTDNSFYKELQEEMPEGYMLIHTVGTTEIYRRDGN